ncbi:PTS ascorbate transporter subunit IIC [Clostridium sp. KNHs216]|uniref:PTS ascorbate transporter subunit IIC n=1 Tax=Clostridium sp. KNHs216 TaxID=1550235 RepID=UPI0011518DB3|nr:PTS ascorbate transporter subunit IIC [Clostridium sp. KNHs216]TQI68301.1 PTS system ascorbate-specific IIC component [Clostridium sp. KNHs216]
MSVITGILNFIVFDLLSQASILVGLMALVGLILQRKKPVQVITGTVKTIVGFLIFGIGSTAAQGALSSFQTLFTKGFHVQGVLPLAEAVTGQAQTKFPMVIALVMVCGFALNLLIARFTKFKFIFLTGQHNLFLAAMLTILFKALGFNDLATIITGAVLLGFSAAIFPALAQPYMRKVTGNDEIAIGHYCTIAYALSGWLGSKVGKPEDSTENLKLPGWLSIFKDYIVSVTLSIGIFYYVAAIAAGRANVEALSGGVHWLVYPLLQALAFSGGLYVIITGVRMFLSEIVPAFVGVSEKFIPNSKPALDCPVVFPYAPTATVLGFICAYLAGIVCMFFFSAVGMTVIIPVAIPYFFIGGTAAVFGNATGGWKGAVLASVATGILIAVGPALMYPVMQSVGLSGTAFPETDFNALGLIIYNIGKLFGLTA